MSYLVIDSSLIAMKMQRIVCAQLQRISPSIPTSCRRNAYLLHGLTTTLQQIRPVVTSSHSGAFDVPLQSLAASETGKTTWSRQKHFRSPKLHRLGVSFDIDGVLLRGSKQLPHAKESLQRLIAADVPFVLLTNGGGETEAVKAAKLSEMLEMPIHPQQVILSHTPLRPIIQQYADKKIFVLGCRDVMSVAKAYGAKRVFDVTMLAQDDPYRYPFLPYEKRELAQHEREEPFAAMFILHDPNNWGAEIQIALDVIRGGWPLGSGGHNSTHHDSANKSHITQSIPVYASNPDLIFAGVYPVPRLACGSFTHCLKSLWTHLHGSELHVTQCGKPTKLTFDFAAKQLAHWINLAHTHNYHTMSADEQVLFAQSHGHVMDAVSRPHISNSTTTHTSSTLYHTVDTPVSNIGGSGLGFDHLFHIGDNPAADMRGALNAGHPWKGILVKTGVYTAKNTHASSNTQSKHTGRAGIEGDNDADHPGYACVHGVKDAIDFILSHA